jgi:8-oxo-dGTP pyrophosphatase MutT (NUDIX family)
VEKCIFQNLAALFRRGVDEIHWIQLEISYLKPSQIIVCVILFDSSGNVLLQHRDDKPQINYPGLWTASGGTVEQGELLEAAAARELREETGLRSVGLALFHTDNHLLPSGTVTRRNFFLGEYDGVQKIKLGEGQELRFVALEKLSEFPLVPDLEWIIRKAGRLRENGTTAPKNKLGNIGYRPA